MAPISMAGMGGNGLDCFRVMSNAKVFATRDGRPVGRPKTAHYIDPYVTHMDQKCFYTERLREVPKLY